MCVPTGSDQTNTMFCPLHVYLHSSRQNLSGVDMNMPDYDNRTGLHLAACEGHIETVQFLIEKCGANPNVQDR